MRLSRAKKYYLSGPMTGLPNYNRPAFNRMAKLLRSKGFKVENPAENPEQESWEEHMDVAIAQLKTCNSIIMLQGWENSKGAKIEFETARKLGMLIICESDLYTHNVIGRIATDLEI